MNHSLFSLSRSKPFVTHLQIFLFIGYVFLASLLPLQLFASNPADSNIDIAHFGALGDDRSDTTPALRAALTVIRKQSLHRLLFSAKRYDFWPDQAEEKYMFISNNDEGLKRIAFLLSGIHDLEIDGQGAQFVFHGYLNPFILDQSQNITLKNFSIDFARTFSSEAKILAVHDDGVDLSIDKQYPYKIVDGQLIFTGEGAESNIFYPVDSILEFDPNKRETAYDVSDMGHGANFQLLK